MGDLCSDKTKKKTKREEDMESRKKGNLMQKMEREFLGLLGREAPEKQLRVSGSRCGKSEGTWESRRMELMLNVYVCIEKRLASLGKYL